MPVAVLLAHGARDLASVLEMSSETKTREIQKRHGLFQMMDAPCYLERCITNDAFAGSLSGPCRRAGGVATVPVSL